MERDLDKKLYNDYDLTQEILQKPKTFQETIVLKKQYKMAVLFLKTIK